MADKYNPTIPPDSQKAGLGGQRIRELTEDVDDVLEVEHDVTDGVRMGKHQLSNANVPVAGIADKILVYGKDVDSGGTDYAELHTIDEQDQEVCVTKNGRVYHPITSQMAFDNVDNPAAGTANAIALYSEDRDSKARLRGVDEDDVVFPIEGYAGDSDTTRGTTATSWEWEDNLYLTFTGVAGEYYDCLMMIATIASLTAGTVTYTMDEETSKGTMFISPDGHPQNVGTTAETNVLLHGVFRVSSGGSVTIKMKWYRTGGGGGTCGNRYLKIKRIV